MWVEPAEPEGEQTVGGAAEPVTGPSPGESLVGFLRSLGATDEEIERARRECGISRLPSDLILTRDAHLDAVDLAARADLSPDEVVGLWRTLGVTVPDKRTVMFSERDVAFTSLAVRVEPLGIHADELYRVLGSSLGRVADAAVALYVQLVEPDVQLVAPEMSASEEDLLPWLRSAAETTALALRLGDAMGAIFAHLLRDAIERQRAAQEDIVDRSLFHLAVGFVDLVGFTPLSQHADPRRVLALIGEFEGRAFDIATEHEGRIVKHIGDEVMFVALDPRDACAIAHELTQTDAEGIEPRGGVALGDVIARHGDYYGPVVNLASRLAELAIPREVLVDVPTAAAVGGAFSFRPAGHRLLKGFDQPVEVFSLDAARAG